MGTKLNVMEEEYGGMFHVMLRKSTETKWSALMWNLIHVTIDVDGDAAKDIRIWPKFSDWCTEEWRKDPSQPFCGIVDKWVKHCDNSYGDKTVPRTSTLLNAFNSALELMDEETRSDLDGTAKYYIEEGF